MNKQDNGGPAFPALRDWRTSDQPDPDAGMTLRDYFAAKAMQAQFAIMSLSERDSFQKMCAEQAYKMADAMLRARDA